MTYDQKTVRTLYKKLLALYPRAFRERLGESMEQTFNDLCNERKRQTERGLFGFVLWMFVETAIGIIKEYAIFITEGNAMKNILTNPRSAAIISFLLTLPGAILFLLLTLNIKPLLAPLEPLVTVPPDQPMILGTAIVLGLIVLLPTVAFIITEGNARKNILTNLSSAAIISFLLALPFMILEFMFKVVNRLGALSLRNVLDLTVVFGLLWLLPVVFIVILMSIVRNVRAGNSTMANPANLLFLLSRVAILALIAMFWGGFLIDQLPCFLGVPNCD